MHQGSSSRASVDVGSPDQHARGLLSAPVDPLRYREKLSGSIGASDVGGMLRALVPDGSRLLDVGCGTGTLAQYIARDRDIEVIGIEPDLARAEMGRKLGLNVIHGVLDEKILVDYDAFDVIMFADVLEHVAAPAELIELAARGLAPNGRIIASIPNVAHWSVRFSLLFGNFDYKDTGIMDATHLRWFTRESVQQLFVRCGLEIVSVRATAGTWMPEYASFPWTLAPVRLRHRAVRYLSRRYPSLFGCQHIVEARPARNRN